MNTNDSKNYLLLLLLTDDSAIFALDVESVLSITFAMLLIGNAFTNKTFLRNENIFFSHGNYPSLQQN